MANLSDRIKSLRLSADMTAGRIWQEVWNSKINRFII